jgi:hypothetical protein
MINAVIIGYDNQGVYLLLLGEAEGFEPRPPHCQRGVDLPRKLAKSK